MAAKENIDTKIHNIYGDLDSVTWKPATAKIGRHMVTAVVILYGNPVFYTIKNQII